MDQTNQVRPPPFIPNPANPNFPLLPTPSFSIYPSRSQIDPLNLWIPPSRSGLYFQVWKSTRKLPLHDLRLLVPHASHRPPPPHTCPCLFTLTPSLISFRCPNSIPTPPPPPPFPPSLLPPPPYPLSPIPLPPSSPQPPMGGHAQDHRSIRNGSKACHVTKHQPSSSNPPPVSSPSFLCPSPVLTNNDPTTSDPTANPSDAYNNNGWSYHTEEQLEELLLKNLDFVYQEVLNRLVTLGYDKELALQAVLCSDHCYGSMDMLSNNIFQNALAHLSSSKTVGDHDTCSSVPARGFTNLRHLQEYSLARMVCLLQQIRPHLSRGDAMWYLLMSDLHVDHASTIDMPHLPPSPTPMLSSNPDSAADVVDGVDCAPPLADLYKFHVMMSGGESTNLPPAIRWNANTSELSPGAGFLPCKKSLPQPMAEVGLGSSSFEQLQGNASATIIRIGDDAQENLVDSALKALEAMNLKEEGKLPDGVEDHKIEMILDLVRHIRELEVHVKDRRDWAQKTALQAARKMSNDMIELRALRMEREENQHMKKEKRALEDVTMESLTEMENMLRKVGGQVDHANVAVRRLGTNNAEIRAEIESSKLSASESARACMEVVRREKKCLKKVRAREKQKEKIQREIAEEKRKTAETEQKLAEVRAASKEMEAKWKQEIKLREQATAQADEAHRARKAAEINAKRRQEALQQKIEVNFLRFKDDIKRLEEELSHLQAAAASTQLNNSSFNVLNPGDVDATKALKKGKEKMHTGFDKPQESSQNLNCNRVCVICLKDEVSVLFLPCAHQVVCVNCNKDHEKKGKGSCPCCNVKIDERIRVYGASS